MFLPHDKDGRSVWDYAGGIWRELCQIKDALTDEDPERTMIRWLSLTGADWAGGTTVRGSLRVPVGCRWDALAISGGMGGLIAGSVELFRNTEEHVSFITRREATGSDGRIPMTNLPDHLVLEENTLIIARFDCAGGAAGTFPVVNFAFREVYYSEPKLTHERGESIAQGGQFEWEDPELDRIAEVEYEQARANGRRS